MNKEEYGEGEEEGKNKKEKEIGTGEESGAEDREARDSGLSRVVITKEADLAVSEVVSAANEGFEAGHITKLDAASFMLKWFKTNAGPDVITRLRLECSDEMTMLENVVKKARASGELPMQLREFLAKEFFGGAAKPEKKSKKNLKRLYIKDISQEKKAS